MASTPVQFPINNVDDHLWNVGDPLDAGNGQWRLAPAFDVNPFPDRERESKTWLSEDTGPITSLKQLIDGSAYFGLQPIQAQEEASAMAAAVANWLDRDVQGCRAHRRRTASIRPRLSAKRVTAALLYRHALGEIARLVDVRAFEDCDVVGKELQGDGVDGGSLEVSHVLRHLDDSNAIARLEA